MKTFEEIKEILSQSKPIVQEKYKVKEMGVFGSYVNCGFSSQCGCNNDLVEVGICLETNFHAPDACR
jgi:hypothetical protein